MLLLFSFHSSDFRFSSSNPPFIVTQCFLLFQNISNACIVCLCVFVYNSPYFTSVCNCTHVYVCDPSCQSQLVALLQAWVGHPYLDVIDNSTDFQGKLKRVIKVGIDKKEEQRAAL